VAPVPFYFDGVLIHAYGHQSSRTDGVPSGDGQRLVYDAFFIQYKKMIDGSGEERLVPLNFKAQEIHQANQDAPLLIDGSEYDYFLFFMHIVHGEEGTFRVLQNDMLTFVQKILIDNGDEGIANDLRPPRFLRFTVDGSCIYTAHVLYAGAIFECKIKVRPDGMVEMTDDEMLCEPSDRLKERAQGAD
jgi:hypothetical protein